MAKRIPTEIEMHGKVRVDEYYWLKDRENPEVIAYLEAENTHARAVMAHTEPLQQKLFDEIRGRIRKTDESVPYLKGGDYYSLRYREDGEYAIHMRRRGSLEAPAEILLDENELAEGHEFFSMAGREVSPDGAVLAFAVDYIGRRQHTVRFEELETGRLLPDEIQSVSGNLAWAADSRTLFYAAMDPVTLRWDRIFRHRLGTDPAADVLVYEEEDDTFSVSVEVSTSRRYLLILSSQTMTTEVHTLLAADPTGSPRVLAPRERGHEYDVDHYAGRFFIRSNSEAPNFRLLAVSEEAPDRQNWEECVPHREDVLLSDFALFRDHLVLAERAGGLTCLHVVPWSGEGEHCLEFQEPAYHVRLGDNFEPDTEVLRFEYTSLTTPTSTFDYNMRSRERRLLKTEEVVGGYDRGRYRSERLFAPAADGTEIPISLVYRSDLRREGGGPLLLYGYGSYGISIDPAFQSARLSLLDRGFTFAIAHVRGGQEMGRRWYEDGKLLRKRNTFTDFIACGKYLIDRGYAAPDLLFATGGSAGGLLMGAVINLEPELFRGVVAAVPFVDVVTTMMDDAIPLTTGEYDEWGDPRDPALFDYILSYSPYDNVEPKAYPHLLARTGLHDSQVQYWEPAKWVARLRATKTDDHLLLLKTDMGAGHGGASGRYRRYRDVALEYAFLLDLAGLSGVDRPPALPHARPPAPPQARPPTPPHAHPPAPPRARPQSG